VLVLNRNWQAINVRTPQEAFCMMATNVATGLEIDYTTPTESADSPFCTPHSPLFTPRAWEEWIKLPIRDQDEAVHTLRGQIRVPTVIVAVNCAKVPKKRPRLCAKAIRGLEPGTYLALLSHSGSRGTGAAVCDHYSKLAFSQFPGLPSELKRLAWLSLDSQEGQEYWAAMELMGRYAAANHALIHKHVAANLGAEVLLDLENHHNFAWKERHAINGVEREVIVHRKGATPAGQGVLGIIPGSMASPGFVVSGKGNAESLNSASHGAGRVMSRTQANKTFEWKKVNAILREKGVTLISAGLDEVPMVYKNIHEVMAAQHDLVTILGQFDPKLVKMAPHWERAED
jgi:RNA-splicing ligase RtcB